MQIVLIASGTRGDVQPMLALGHGLRAAGHSLRVLAGANFAGWVAAHGFDFSPMLDMEAVMRSELGLRWAESKRQWEQLRTMQSLLRANGAGMVRDVLAGTQGADLLIGGFTAEPFVQAICEQRGIPQLSVALQPYRATRSGPASLLPLLPRRASRLNHWAGGIAERVSWMVARDWANQLRRQLGLRPHTAGSYLRAVHATPALYAVSRHVVPPAGDVNAHTTGYWFLDEEAAPSAELRAFVAAGPAPVYVGFGSMPSRDPAQTLRMVAEALARVGRRGVLARGWSTAAEVAVPAHICLVDVAPHAWLFPRMAALVHHGGAGTTAAGLRAGKPALIVPHLADQPFWGRRLHELGAGPPPLPRAQLSADTLAGRLAALLGDERIAANAAALGERIRAERGVDIAVEWINGWLARPD